MLHINRLRTNLIINLLLLQYGLFNIANSRRILDTTKSSAVNQTSKEFALEIVSTCGFIELHSNFFTTQLYINDSYKIQNVTLMDNMEEAN